MKTKRGLSDQLLKISKFISSVFDDVISHVTIRTRNLAFVMMPIVKDNFIQLGYF